MTLGPLFHVLFHTHGVVKMLACDYFLVINCKRRLVVVAFGHVIPLWEESSWKYYHVTLMGNLEKLRRKLYFALTERFYATSIFLIPLLNCYTGISGTAVFRSLFFH